MLTQIEMKRITKLEDLECLIRMDVIEGVEGNYVYHGVDKMFSRTNCKEFTFYRRLDDKRIIYLVTRKPEVFLALDDEKNALSRGFKGVLFKDGSYNHAQNVDYEIADKLLEEAGI